MLGPLAYAFWLLTVLLQTAVVVCAFRAKCFFQFFPLNFYMLAASALTVGRYVILSEYGFKSGQYFRFYFYSDTLLTICLFFALMGLFGHVFREMGAQLYIRIGSVVVLGLTSAISYALVRHSYAVVGQSESKFLYDFLAEFSQNLYFLGAVLTYLLWAAVKKLHETRTQLIQFVLALGIYFSALAATYALAVLNPHNPIWTFGPVATGLWLPLAWGYTFLKVPKNARLATARVAMGSH